VWRGSDNQRVHLLTGRHADIRARLSERGNRLELVVAEEGYFWMGIPPQGFDERLAEMLRERGLESPPRG